MAWVQLAGKAGNYLRIILTSVCLLGVQGIDVGNFEQFIEQNKPVTFTDPKVLMMLFPTLNNSVNDVGGSVHLWTPRPFLEFLWDSILNGS